MTRLTDMRFRGIAGLLLAGFLILAGTPALQAQGTVTDTRWQAWLGCWQSSNPQLSGRALYLCVTPASGSSAVNVVTIADGKDISRERIEATGQRRPIAKNGCSGWESAQWSGDGRRVYVQSELNCAGSPVRTSNGIFAISGAGEWLHVDIIRGGRGSGLAVSRYHDAGIPVPVPAEITAALAGSRQSISAARLAAGAPIGTADVIDAVRNADPDAVNGWLVERGQALEANARQIAALADAGVPGSVTDVLLALAYPNVLALNRGTPADPAYNGDDYQRAGRGSQIYLGGFGYSPFGYSPYGYLGYGAGYGSYLNTSPYIIVTKGSAALARGRAVKGRGYTRGDGSTAATPSRGSVGSSGAGASHPSSGSSGRTAKPRH